MKQTKEEMKKFVNTLFLEYFKEPIKLYTPRQTYNFVINGKSGSGKDTFIECVNVFTPVNNISTIDIIKEMAKHVNLEENRDFLKKLKEMVYYYTNYIDHNIQHRIKPYHLNFIHVREEKFFNKSPYTYMIKILIENPNITGNEFVNLKDFEFNRHKYNHIIFNDKLEDLPYKAWEFVKIYCDKEEEDKIYYYNKFKDLFKGTEFENKNKEE